MMKRKDFLRVSAALPFMLYSGFGYKNLTDKRLFPNLTDKRLFPFAYAFPPRAERPYPSDSWLEAIKQAGYSHVILANNPFSVFSLVDIWNFTVGPDASRLQSWLEEMSKLVSAHNLKLSMALWEPRMPTPGPQSKLPSHWTSSSKGHWLIKINTVPEAREWMLNGFKMILEKAPSLDTFVLGANDNGVIWEREHETESLPTLMADFYRDLHDTCQQVRPTIIIPYSWNWHTDYNEPIFSRLPAGTPIVTRMERGSIYTPDKSHPEWSGTVQDMSMGSDALGTEFMEALHCRKTYGTKLITMITLSGMFEGWDVPYIPAIGKMLSKFNRMREQQVVSWVDYDCGGVHEGLMTDLVKVVQHNPDTPEEEWKQILAATRYGSNAVSTAIAAWSDFDRGISIYPSVLKFPPPGRGEFNLGSFVLGYVPMMPFFKELALIADERRPTYVRDPHYWLHKDALPVFRTLISKAVEHAEHGFGHYEKTLQMASSTPYMKNAQKDIAIAELAMLSWRSVKNFFDWAAAVQGVDQGIDLSRVLRSEIEVTARYRELALRPELQVGNMTWNTAGEVRGIMYKVNPGYDNDRIKKGQDYYQWKIDHLRGQIPL